MLRQWRAFGVVATVAVVVAAVGLIRETVVRGTTVQDQDQAAPAEGRLAMVQATQNQVLVAYRLGSKVCFVVQKPTTNGNINPFVGVTSVTFTPGTQTGTPVIWSMTGSTLLANGRLLIKCQTYAVGPTARLEGGPAPPTLHTPLGSGQITVTVTDSGGQTTVPVDTQQVDFDPCAT